MEEIHHQNGTGNPKYVEVTKRSSARTYSNNFWLAVQDIYAELIAHGASNNVAKHFIRGELKIDLELCDKMFMKKNVSKTVKKLMGETS